MNAVINYEVLPLKENVDTASIHPFDFAQAFGSEDFDGERSVEPLMLEEVFSRSRITLGLYNFPFKMILDFFKQPVFSASFLE